MQKKLRFKSDTFTIYGTLHLPSDKTPPVVIGSHGLLSSGDSPKQIALAEQCIAKGIAYFRFDHRGCGNSTGDFGSVTTFDGRCRDLVRAVETVLSLPETGNRIALFGSSFGGAVSLAMHDAVRATSIVTVAAPVRLESIKPPYINDPENQPRLKSLDKKKLSFDIADRLSGITHILIFHGDRDEVVPFSNAIEIYEHAGEPKKLIQQKNGDHPMSNPKHQDKFIRLAVEWFQKGFLN